MGEKNEMAEGAEEENNDEDDEGVDLRKIVNLGRMYADLVAEGVLPITVLKVILFLSNLVFPFESYVRFFRIEVVTLIDLDLASTTGDSNSLRN